MTYDTLRSATALASVLLAITPLCALSARAADTQKLTTVVAEQARTDEAAIVAQQRIDQINDETQEMVGKYRQALTDAESLNGYADQLQVQVDSQRDELGSVEKQLAEIEGTSRDVLPMMQRMVDTLEQFVALDVPFLPEERGKRVAGLKDIMGRSDITISEKYRRILEAYQIEMDYGRSVESQEGKLTDGGAEKAVQFLRVGRIALLYQTLDGNETGYWDQDQRKWVQDDSYRIAVRDGLKVAKKEVAPELLVIPVPAPKESKS